MPRGHPDWWIQTGQFSFADIDTAELAARLGSPVTYQRSGRVIYFTDFEVDRNDWSFWVSGEGNGGIGNGIIEVFAGEGIAGGMQPFRGSQCLKIKADDVADNAGYYWTNAIKLLPAVWSGNIGIELLLAPDTDATSFNLHITHDDAGVERLAGILIDFTNDELSYLSGHSPLVYTVFDDIPGGEWGRVSGTSLRWGIVKLIISADLTKYVGLYINNHFFDLSDHAIPTGSFPVSSFERLSIQLFVSDSDGTGGSCYVDGVIVTQDEP